MTVSGTYQRRRRNALLAAGQIELATAFLEHEKSVSTLGSVQGRLAFELRLALAEARYDDLISRSLSAKDWPTESERKAAQRTLEYYQALAELSREGGNLEHAERTLARLAKHDPTNAAAAVNLHAVRIRRARDAKAPTRVAPTLRAEATRLLERRELEEGHRNTIEANLAVLDTYVGDFQSAVDRLRQLPEEVHYAPVPTTTAVHGLVELSDVPAAHAWLETAAEWTGWTDALVAIRDELEAERPRSRSGEVSVAEDDSIEGLCEVPVELLTVDCLAELAHPRSHVRLMTAHRSKGREFGAVAIVHVHEGRFPFFSATTTEEVEDGLRVLYVAATRAERLLVFVTDQSDYRNPPSRFLRGLPVTRSDATV